jgi:hypothetical protein
MNMLLPLQSLIKLALVLLMGLLPLYHTQAQETQKTERKMRVKMVTTENGKTVVIDTTLTGTTEAEIAAALRAAKLDTAMLRLHGKQMRAYTIERGEMDKARLQAGKARVQALRADSTMRHMLKGVRVMELRADSMSKEMVKRFKIVQGDSLLMGKGQRLYVRTLSDSSLYPLGSDLKAITINPQEIERIIVKAMPSPARMDSLMKLHENVNFKVIVKDGEKKVYRIHEDGREEEVPNTDFNFGFGDAKMGRAVFIVRKAKIETPTTAEKEQLKATGTPVEMKSREELKVEDISYYPNPNNGRFNLRFSLKNKGTTVVRVLDAQGKEVFVDTVEKLTGTYEREIDLTPFGRGMFFLQVAQGGRYHTKKIVVQ